MQYTLKKHYLQIGDIEKVIYDFSDNHKYMISIDKCNEAEADRRLEAFQSGKSDIFTLRDIGEYQPRLNK